MKNLKGGEDPQELRLDVPHSLDSLYHHVPQAEQIQQSATSQRKKHLSQRRGEDSTMSGGMSKRLLKEFQLAQRELGLASGSSRSASANPDLLELRPWDVEGEDLTEWIAVIRGPEGGYYAGESIDMLLLCETFADVLYSIQVAHSSSGYVYLPPIRQNLQQSASKHACSIPTFRGKTAKYVSMCCKISGHQRGRSARRALPSLRF